MRDGGMPTACGSSFAGVRLNRVGTGARPEEKESLSRVPLWELPMQESAPRIQSCIRFKDLTLQKRTLWRKDSLCERRIRRMESDRGTRAGRGACRGCGGRTALIQARTVNG